MAHQHQKGHHGHTVPKQVSPLDDDDDDITKNVMVLQSENCTV